MIRRSQKAPGDGTAQRLVDPLTRSPLPSPHTCSINRSPPPGWPHRPRPPHLHRCAQCGTGSGGRPPITVTELTDGAELRPLSPEHAQEFLDHINRGREYIGRFIRLPDLVTDHDSAQAYLYEYAVHAANDTGRLDGIWSDDRLVGAVLLRSMDVPEGIAEAGCWLEPAAAGRGLVTRAARLFIDWAIEKRGIHRVEWRVAPQNTASIAVARRLGMRRDGVLRERYLHRGIRYDAEVWSVLAPEWRRNRDARSAR